MSATLVFDGNCGFCTLCVDWLQARLDPRRTDVAVEPWQRLDLLGLTEPEVTTAAYWVEDGQRLRGARAIAAALRVCRNPVWRAAGRLIDVPPVRPLARLGYRLVADNRSHLPGTTPALKR